MCGTVVVNPTQPYSTCINKYIYIYIHSHIFFQNYFIQCFTHTSAISYVMLVSTTSWQLKNLLIKYTIIPVKI